MKILEEASFDEVRARYIAESQAVVEACRSVGVSIQPTGDGRFAVNNVRALESQAQVAELRAAFAKVDEIACRSISAAGFGDEPPEPANRDGEELADVARAALARPADDSALKAAIETARADERAKIDIEWEQATAFASQPKTPTMQAIIDSALREFGLKVVERERTRRDWEEMDALVDAVLEGR